MLGRVVKNSTNRVESANANFAYQLHAIEWISMPFVKGAPKPAGSGRKKGQTCVLAADVRTKLQELGCDPIAGLANIAAREDVSPELQAHCLGKLSKFCYPELRATDHRFVDEDGKDRTFTLADARALAAGG